MALGGLVPGCRVDEILLLAAKKMAGVVLPAVQ
jgi:hypothetical protein